MFQRERESLDKQFKVISAKVLEAKHTLDKLYFNEKLEEEYKDVFEDICTLLDKLMVVRMDFEELSKHSGISTPIHYKNCIQSSDYDNP